MPTWVPIVTSVLLAFIPVFIWSRIIRQKTSQERRYLIMVFMGGSLSVIPIFIFQWLWEKFPALNIIALIERGIESPEKAALGVFIFVGVMEEVVKHLVVRFTDHRHPELIQTVNDALVLSIVAALGFAFAENIFYFYSIWVNLGLVDLFSSFVFRSSFTAAGHMIFSGIFGYYFGIGKFASDITANERYQGNKFYFTRFFGRIFGWKTYEAFRQQKILAGLFLAMTLHAIFNFLLQLNHIIAVMLLIAICATFVYYLIHRISGNLLFSFSARKTSTMALKDEEVVIELLGMWMNDGKYNAVAEICDRLLKRDPDNNVVKLFRAKAKDNQKLRHVYENLKGMFAKAQVQVSASELPPMTAENEKVIAEVLDMWFQEKKFSQVVEVAKRLLARNPKSEGAKMILKKAMDKEKLRKVFDSLKFLFEA